MARTNNSFRLSALLAAMIAATVVTGLLVGQGPASAQSTPNTIIVNTTQPKQACTEENVVTPNLTKPLVNTIRHDSIEICWPQGTSGTTSFEVQYKKSEDDTWSSTTMPGDSKGWKHTEGLVEGERYDYQVRSCKGSACSSWSDEMSATARRQWDDDKHFENLDYGVYWFKCGACRDDDADGVNESDGVRAKPTDNLADVGTAYYDPTKPTFIYVHGIQTEGNHKRESFVSSTDGRTDMAKAWLEKGWNVGIFYWNQIGDDEGIFGPIPDGIPPYKVECKVWSQDCMRWRDKNDNFRYAPDGLPSSKNVADLFVDSYKEAMQDQENSNIRVAGHSMGNQVAVLGTDSLRTAVPTEQRPKRVALLDPYYSEGPNPHFDFDDDGWPDFSPKDRVPGIVRAMKEDYGIAFEYYHTSRTFIQPIDGISNEMAYARMYPNELDPSTQHQDAVHWYMDSISYSPPAYVWQQVRQKKKIRKKTILVPAGVAPSATMSDEEIRQINLCQPACYSWDQISGNDSASVGYGAGNDAFVRKQR